MASAPPEILLQDVTFAPGGVTVLDALSLRCAARRVGVIGRNGSGKTSLARVMAGLVPADAGRVRVAGVDVARDRKAALGTVGILFQNPDHQIIFPTVEEELAFGLRQMGQSKEDAAAGVAAVLAQFGKAHWPKAPIVELSQGQRQLVCLMAVLAMGPRVIILDEPFAGLDIPVAMQLERVLAGLDQTLVLITHDPDRLAGYDQVIWIDEGRVAQHGAAPEVVPAFTARMQALGRGDDLSDLAT
ncbi:MAG: ABC transporter ATP-binding protein [Pseudomonadota bacterium]